MTEACYASASDCLQSSSGSVVLGSMWQTTQQYSMPPQRLYDDPFMQQPFVYSQFPQAPVQQMAGNVPSSANNSSMSSSTPAMYYFNHPHPQIYHPTHPIQPHREHYQHLQQHPYHHQQQQQQILPPPPPAQQQQAPAQRHRQHQQQQPTQPAKTVAPLPPPPPPPPPAERIGSPNGMDMCGSNPRASRNAAEKHRRDNLNTHIQTMATLVPTVNCSGSRKRDKISILRLTANFLRINYTLGVPTEKFLPEIYNAFDLENKLIESVSGSLSFLLVMTTSGKIIYVSNHVEQHLGHEQTEMMGDSLYHFTFDEDKEELRRNLTPDISCLPALVSSSDSLEDGSNSSSDDSANYQPDYRQFQRQRRCFNIRLSVKSNSRRDAAHFEYTQLSGFLRLANEKKLEEQANNGKCKKSSNPTSNDIIFVGTGKLLQRRSVSELTFLVQNRSEYFTRHLIDGRIIFCDHRISVVAGYMAQEVSGSSAFRFMHKDDVRWTIVALRHMYDRGTPYGSSCYRLMAKTGQYIYLRTHGYLEIDEQTKTVTSFICINTLTSEDEGLELIADLKKRFSATINAASRAIHGNDSGFESDTECTSTMSIPMSMDGSDQLEQAINELVTDLPAMVNSEEPCPDQQYCKAIVYSHKLPPAMVHANQAGITDVDNIYFGKGGKGGKGKGAATGKTTGKGKGKQSPTTATSADSPSEYSRRNGERVSSIGEKRIPELEDSPSPVVAPKPTALSTDKIFSSPNPSESESYSEGLAIEDDLSTNATTSSDVSTSYNVPTSIASSYVQPSAPYDSNLQRGMKRPYKSEDEAVAPKKKATENCVTIELVDVNDFVNSNGDMGFPAYIEVQSTSLGPDLQEMPTNFQQLDTDSITLGSNEGSFIEFQEFSDELDPNIQNNPDVIKLLTNLPQTITLEGTGEDVDVCQYPDSDLRD